MTRRYLSAALILLSAVVCCWLPCLVIGDSGSGNIPNHEPGLLLDYAAFYNPASDKIRLEVYYQLFSHVLQFEPQDSGFVAAYECVIRVKDKSGQQIDSYTRDREIRVTDERRTASRLDFRINQASFELEPGKYEVALTLRDKQSSKMISRDVELKLKDFNSKKPRLSDIEFVMATGPVDQEPSIFDKGSLAVVPSVSREFGGAGDDRVAYYIEIYRGRDSMSNVFVETTIRSERGSMAYRDSLTAELSNAVTRQFCEVSLSNLTPGDYRLEVILRGRRNKKLDQKEKTFRVEWTQEALIRNDFKEVLNILSLIATSEEIDELKKHESYDDRVRAIEAFWLSRDPTQGTVDNETRSEFYRRVRYANKNFGYFRQRGWHSDRGRTYISYGEPDEIDDFPISPNRRPYQIWHYYQGGRYLKFTFIDENEDGDYRLMYPFDGMDQRPDF
ncbi:MAG: GWxTD domain-containing protein [candidate division Zixibacteria bacterium]|nr:GWxTD domain-containing protein [candidate division Zixibacteria bacterium]